MNLSVNPFQPDGTYDPVPGTSFVVSRSAYRSGSSDYRYNGKVKDFKEIAALLAGVGIDLIHNRFLILQVRDCFLKSRINRDYYFLFPCVTAFGGLAFRLFFVR